MPSFTLTNLLARLRRKGNYPNTGNHPASPISDTFLTEELNAAIGEYENILDDRWEGYRDKTGTVNTVANTATVALPADFKRLRSRPWIASGDVPCPLHRLNADQTHVFYNQRDRPCGYLFSGANLELFATPNAVYTINLRYTPTATVLSSGSDTISIPNGWERYVIDLALLAVDQQQQRSVQDRLGILERLRQEVVDAAGDRNVAEPEVIPFPWEGREMVLP